MDFKFTDISELSESLKSLLKSRGMGNDPVNTANRLLKETISANQRSMLCEIASLIVTAGIPAERSGSPSTFVFTETIIPSMEAIALMCSRGITDPAKIIATANKVLEGVPVRDRAFIVDSETASKAVIRYLPSYLDKSRTRFRFSAEAPPGPDVVCMFLVNGIPQTDRMLNISNKILESIPDSERASAVDAETASKVVVRYLPIYLGNS